MKTFILIYEGFVQFETVLASFLLKSKGDIITVGLDENTVTSLEGFLVTPHITLDKIEINDVDVFIIPGGEQEVLEHCKELYKLLYDLDKKNCIIGAVCSGPIHLAWANILKGKRYTTSLKIENHKEFEKEGYVNQNVVIDGNLITAKASGYVDFAIEIGKMMKVYKDEADLVETIEFFKYFKS